MEEMIYGNWPHPEQQAPFIFLVQSSPPMNSGEKGTHKVMWLLNPRSLPHRSHPEIKAFFFSFVASTLKHQIATPPNTNLIIWLSRSDSAKVFVSGTLKILNSQWSSIRMWDLLHFNTVFKKTLWFSSHLGNFIQFTFLLNHWFYRDLLYGCSEPMLIPQNGLSWICSCQTHLNLPFPV